jgi:type IV pilus assembly protein PilB
MVAMFNKIDPESLDLMTLNPKFYDICHAELKQDSAIVITEDNLLIIEEALKSEKALINRFSTIIFRDTNQQAKVLIADRVAIITLLGRAKMPDSKAELITDDQKNIAKDIFNKILSKGVHLRASDVHIRKTHNDPCVYYRVDGVLTKPEIYSESHLNLALNHFINSKIQNIKVMADDNVPSSGTIHDFPVTMGNEIVKKELRLSKIPVEGGSKTVIRINDGQEKAKNLDDFSYDEDIVAFLRKEVSQSYGTTIITGPTGSGKTNVLAALTNEIPSTKQRNTLEDPVEIKIPGVDQASVIEGSEYATFGKLLKDMLRQDPDTLTLGELRDAETARHLLGFARTGHYTMSTLHVNCAALTPERLNDMGVAFTEMRSTLSSVIAVRLVPLLCSDCKLTVDDAVITLEDRKRLLTMSPDLSKFCLKNPVGCDSCLGLGVMGRRSVLEYIKILESDFEWIEGRNIYAWMRHLKESRGWKSMGDRVKVLAMEGVVDPFQAESFVEGVFDEKSDN